MPTGKSGKKHAKKDEGIAENVIGLVRTSVLAGIGMAFLGEEKIEEWARKIAKENKMPLKDIANFINDVKRQSVQARKDVEKRLRDMTKEITVSNKEKSSTSSKKIHLKKKKKSQRSSKMQRWSVSFIPNKEFTNPQS
jgi:polyhydroxyalkanoate synthesis regulator phasin